MAYNSAKLKRSLTKRLSGLYIMILTATYKEEEERCLQLLGEQEPREEEDDDTGQDKFGTADDVGSILDL
uniref:Uncharacterized protein n=1 Tax=Peronospora matthiolae TaxID=2874970 RepID=A0AAV1TI15_9STRA